MPRAAVPARAGDCRLGESWEPWLRLALVCCFALVWSTMFFPRKRNRDAAEDP